MTNTIVCRGKAFGKYYAVKLVVIDDFLHAFDGFFVGVFTATVFDFPVLDNDVAIAHALVTASGVYDQRAHHQHDGQAQYAYAHPTEYVANRDVVRKQQ